MRNATKRKVKVGLSALAAAGLSTWAGAPAAKGDFIISTFNMGVQTDGGNLWQVYVFAATNNGANNTGTMLSANDIIVDSSAPLGIDVEKTSGSGATAKYSANIDGSTPTATGFNASLNGGPAQPAFGDVVGGTFFGVGTGQFTTDLTNNPTPTSTSGTGAAVAGDFVNGQTSTFLSAGNTSANFLKALLNSGSPILDPGFKNGSGPFTVNAGAGANALLNGNVTSLEVDTVAGSIGSPSPTPDNGANAPVAFANVVVPVGTVFTIHGSLGGDSGGPFAFSTVIGGVTPTASLVLQLTGSALANSTNVGTVTMVGSNGHYFPPQTVSGIVNPGATTGNLVIKGFNPANDNQVMGLKVAGENSLSQLISDLNNALQAKNAGAVAEVPTGDAGAIFAGLGEQVELVFPSATTPNVTPEFLSYDTSGYSGNGTVTISQITVLPEPTSIGFLALGGFGLLSRRRRKATV